MWVLTLSRSRTSCCQRLAECLVGNGRLANRRDRAAVRSDDLTGLRAWNHLREVGIFPAGVSIRLPLGHAFEAALFLILLFLSADLFSAAFFQMGRPPDCRKPRL